MKIAFCFSGQIRTGVHNIKNIKRFIGNLWNNCDFFVYTWDVETYTLPQFASKFALDNNVLPGNPYTVDKDVFSKFYNLYNPRSMVVNDYRQWKSNGSIDPNMYCIRNVYELSEQYAKHNNVTYDYVIITRPDVLFDETKVLQEDIEQVIDERTFCYARLYDKIEPIDHLESVYWLSKPFTMHLVSKFQYVIENRHPLKNIDGFVHLKKWVDDGLGLNLVRLANSKTAIYRWQHYENNINSLYL